jgi:hypothetical protein
MTSANLGATMKSDPEHAVLSCVAGLLDNPRTTCGQTRFMLEKLRRYEIAQIRDAFLQNDPSETTRLGLWSHCRRMRKLISGSKSGSQCTRPESPLR